MKLIKLHIIAFDVPFPPDYGGVFDIFYKIQSLAIAGCEIYLHCFQYGREESLELNKYCKEVWYYPRITGFKGFKIGQPYIVSSRKNNLLLQRLLSIDCPILFEGVHSTFYLNHPELRNRFKIIRIHNLEYDYYKQLYYKTNKLIEKLFFKRESIVLKKAEHNLYKANAFWALSLKDHEYFKRFYPVAQHTFIPPFHNNFQITITPGTGTYCLYHGNLSHPENKEAALFLLQNIFNKINTPIFIAGKNPDNELKKVCANLPNCKLIANPDAETMNDLILNAQINILPTFQKSGMKLKLLNALFAGRHIIVNENMLYGTTLHNICNIANTPDNVINTIDKLFNKPFLNNDILFRERELFNYFNTISADKIMSLLSDINTK